MGKFHFLFFIIIMIFGVTSYIGTSSILITVLVVITSFIYFYFIARKIIKDYLMRSKRFHDCYTFINSFIVSLSIKGSLVSAFENEKLAMDKNYLSIYQGISTLHDEEKLDYLKNYFSFDVYNLFLSIVKIYISQGGDIFNLSEYLTSELRRNEDYLITIEGTLKRKAVDFAILWIFTLLMLVILRFSLNEFYIHISNLLFYKLAIGALYLIILISIHILIMKATKVEIRGFKNVHEN